MAKRIWWGFVLLGILAFLYRVRTVLTPFLFAILIAYILYPVVVAVEKRGASRIGSILLVYAIFGAAVGVAFWIALPSLLGDLEEIGRKLPEQAARLQDFGEDAVGFFRRVQLPATIRGPSVLSWNVFRRRISGRPADKMLMAAFTHDPL